MKGDPEFVILKHAAWLDAAKYEAQILGSIIRYPLKPTNDFVPENPLQYNNERGFVEPAEPLTDFVLENTNTTTDHAEATLSSLARLSFKGETNESVKLAGKLIRYKQLQQHSKFWDGLKADKAVSDVVPGWVADAKTWPPCLVVGIMIAEDVEIDYLGAEKREKDGKVELPLAKIAAAATGMPVPNVGNLGAGAGATREFTTVFKAKAAKSNIFALELRIVAATKEWLRKRKLTLGEDGPGFDSGRLAGGGDDSDSDDDPLPAVDELALGNFTEEEYAQMAG
jgi:hypothetical protein